jgi:hypothetical protein
MQHNNCNVAACRWRDKLKALAKQTVYVDKKVKDKEPHPGYHPRHHLFLHAYRLLRLGGDAGEVKRKKEVARGIGFDKLYLAEQPKDDNIMADWNKLFISTK